MQMDVFQFVKSGPKPVQRSEIALEVGEGTTTTTSTLTTTSTISSTTMTSTSSSTSTTSTTALESENDPAEESLVSEEYPDEDEADDGIYDDDDELEEEDYEEPEDYNEYFKEVVQSQTEVPVSDVEGETYCMWFQNGQLQEYSNNFMCLNQKRGFICQKPKNDLLAPARIKDLEVQHFTSGSEADPLGSFHIGFTATGNDDSKGKADYYQVRMVATEKGKEALRDDFDKGYHLQNSDFSNEITSRPDSPQKVGYYERLTIRFEDLGGCPRNQLMDLLVLVDTTKEMIVP